MYFVVLYYPLGNHTAAFFSEDKELCQLNAERLAAFISKGYFWGAEVNSNKYMQDAIYVPSDDESQTMVIRIEELAPNSMLDDCIQLLNKINLKLEIEKEKGQIDADL